MRQVAPGAPQLCCGKVGSEIRPSRGFDFALREMFADGE